MGKIKKSPVMIMLKPQVHLDIKMLAAKNDMTMGELLEKVIAKEVLTIEEEKK